MRNARIHADKIRAHDPFQPEDTSLRGDDCGGLWSLHDVGKLLPEPPMPFVVEETGVSDETKSNLRGLAAAYADALAWYQQRVDGAVTYPGLDWPPMQPHTDAWRAFCDAVEAL